MEKIAIALDDMDKYPSCLAKAEKFLVYDIVDNEIDQLSLASFYSGTVEEKIKFLKQNNIKVLFIKDILDLEFVKIPSYGLRVITKFDDDVIYSELINKYLDENKKVYEEEDIESHEVKEQAYIIPPMSNQYMGIQLPLELGEDISDLHIEKNGNSDGGFRER